MASPIHSVRIVHFDHDPDGGASHAITDQGKVPLTPFLAERDIVVNCTFQDPTSPLVYLRTEDLPAFRPGFLIVDVSCDEGMAFDWARPTTFDEPMFDVGDRVHYYGVDHSPSYLWDSATWDISAAVRSFLRRSWRARPAGRPTRPCAAPSRSRTAASSTRPSSTSRGVSEEHPYLAV